MATRAEIEARMADILNRQDFNARITIWFQRAYTSIQRRFDFKCMEVTEQMTVGSGMSTFPIPNDIKKSMLLYLHDGTGIVTRFREGSIDEVRGYLGAGGCECEPVFTDWYGSLLFAPAITAAQAGLYLRYDYYRWLTPVDNDWFMTKAEDFLVYRGLAESAPFLAADPRLNVWAAFAKEAYEELWKPEQDRKISGPLWLRG